MRLKIELERKNGDFLPFSVNHALQSAFYHSVTHMNEEVGNKWHQEKKMKPWTFSSLQFDRYEVDTKRKGFILTGRKACLYVSSPDDQFIFLLLQGLSQQGLIRILNVEFSITNIQTLITPRFDEGKWHRFEILSGYCAGKNDPERPYIHFFTALESELVPQLIQNARRSFLDYTENIEQSQGNLEMVLDKQFILNHKVGYLVQYKKMEQGGVNIFANQVPLWIKGDAPLVNFIYQAGLGERSSSGFGMLDFRFSSDQPQINKKKTG